MSDVPLMRRIGSVFMARNVVVTGDVVLGDDCSVWPFAVIRGDVAPIHLGRRVNVQDGAVLHCNLNVPLDIADDVAIGHGAVVHGRRVGTRTLIGIHATIMDDAVIGQDCVIAAGALVPPGMKVPDGSVVMGMPGKIVRTIRDDERDYIRFVVEGYVELARRYINEYQNGRKDGDVKKGEASHS